MSEAAREIFFEAAEENGWFLEKSKEIAKKLLLMGDPIEKVAEATELPYETIAGLM